MARLTALSWKVIFEKLQKIGYEAVRQKGSHMTLKHRDSSKKSLTLPRHRLVGKGLLRKILRDAQIDPQDFIKL